MYYIAHNNFATEQQSLKKQQNYLHKQKHNPPSPRMNKVAIPIIVIMYMIGDSGRTGKCSQNYVLKHAVNKICPHLTLIFIHFRGLFDITYMKWVKVAFDISPIFQKFTFLKNESVTTYKNVSAANCAQHMKH